MKTWRERLLEDPCDEAMVVMAGHWSTCSVGEQHELYPSVVLYNDYNTLPMDDVLRDLGCLFYEALLDRQLEEATKLLDAIEERVRNLQVSRV